MKAFIIKDFLVFIYFINIGSSLKDEYIKSYWFIFLAQFL